MTRPVSVFFGKAADVPNSKLPVLVFRAAFAPAVPAKVRRFRYAFRRNGWVGIWTDTVYDYTHFHSNAHEVLGIAEGKVTVILGGSEGRRFRLKAGDMLAIPAGVGHRRIGGDAGLKVVGAYPPGQAHFNMKRKGRAVPRVPFPDTDPLYGSGGPLIRCWTT
jgi:uncharacterized protein YjlB